MKYYADLHLHSRFSMATSKELTLPNIAAVAEKKGIDLIAIPDFTHPKWLKEVEPQINFDKTSGFYELSSSRKSAGSAQNKKVKFLFCAEISAVFSRGEKTHRVHLLVIAPGLREAKEINRALSVLGRLDLDGRPVFGKDIILIVRSILAACPEAVLIPAHIWTPWFSVFGSRSGFDSFEEAFGEYSDKLMAVETGESSDPSNSWRVSDLDNKNLVSFSDAHSLYTLGREMTVFSGEFSFDGLRVAILALPKSPLSTGPKIDGTIEYYAEEGKYHYSGHRKCGVSQSPIETKKYGSLCPVCGKPLTLGVMHRVEELADRTAEDLEIETKNSWIKSKTLDYRPGFTRAVPLIEIIAQAKGIKNSRSKSVMETYHFLCDTFETERKVLFEIPIAEIEKVVGKSIAIATKKNRAGDVKIEPGFDGRYGDISISSMSLKNPLSAQVGQSRLI